jgi:hypothetical protein
MSLWFYADQVTINNGSLVVAVTSGEDISIISAGDGLIIGSFAPVEIKKAYIDGSNNKFIELALEWSDSNQTNVAARAYYTAGDFIAATKALQDANILINDNFLSLDEWGTGLGTVDFVNQAGETHTARTLSQMDADVQAIQDGNQSIIDASVSDSIAAIRYGKLDNPLAHLFKKNKLVDTLKGELSRARDSGATLMNQYGKLQYSPSPYATNLCLYSEDLSNVAWTQARTLATETDNVVNKVVATATTSNAFSQNQAITVSSVGVYTLSTFVKKGSLRHMMLKENTHNVRIGFDAHTGRITETSSVPVINPKVEKYGDLYRISFSFDVTNTTLSVQTYLKDVEGIGEGADLTIGDYMYVGGTQLEKSKVANGYVKTEDVSVSGSSYVGIDVARQEKEGWLIEGASTNLFLHSNNFVDSYWTKANSTAVPPDSNLMLGTVSTTTLVPNAGVSNTSFRAAPTVSDGATLTLSVFASDVMGLYNLQLLIGRSGSTSFGAATFDLSVGSHIKAASAISSSMVKVDGGYRCSVTVEIDAGTTTPLCIIECDDVGDGVSGMAVCNAQLEELPFATSYIPTTDAPATRSSGKNSIPYEGNVPRGDQPFTFVFSGVIDGYTAFNRLFDTDTASVSSQLFAQLDASRRIYFTNGGDQNVVATAPIEFGDHFTYIVTFDGVTYKSYLNGVLNGSFLAVSPSTVLSNAFMVMKGSNSANDSYGTCSDFRVYDYPLNQLEISLLEGE